MVDGDTDCIWHKKAQTVTKEWLTQEIVAGFRMV